MKVIDVAFQEAISNTPPKPRKGWWGCGKDGVFYIMRYQHTMVTFNKTAHRICTNETRTDTAGINNAIELIKQWQDTTDKETQK